LSLIVLPPFFWAKGKDIMRPKVLITRKIFDEAIAIIKKHFDMEDNQRDVAFSPEELVRRLRGKAGTIILLTDRIDEAVLSQCPDLKIVSNIAAGYNNIDVPACTRHKVMVTNTPGVLDNTTADFTWTLLLATARRLVEADQYLESEKRGQEKRGQPLTRDSFSSRSLISPLSLSSPLILSLSLVPILVTPE